MGKVVAFEVCVGFDKAFMAIYVIGRAKPRELEKFAYQMGLIEVSEINCKVLHTENPIRLLDACTYKISP